MRATAGKTREPDVARRRSPRPATRARRSPTRGWGRPGDGGDRATGRARLHQGLWRRHLRPERHHPARPDGRADRPRDALGPTCRRAPLRSAINSAAIANSGRTRHPGAAQGVARATATAPTARSTRPQRPGRRLRQPRMVAGAATGPQHADDPARSTRTCLTSTGHRQDLADLLHYAGLTPRDRQRTGASPTGTARHARLVRPSSGRRSPATSHSTACRSGDAPRCAMFTRGGPCGRRLWRPRGVSSTGGHRPPRPPRSSLAAQRQRGLGAFEAGGHRTE